MRILESEMLFGDFSPDRVFKIEDSKLHNQLGDGVKTVEFVLLNGKDKFFFVEAKSSSPRLDNSPPKYQEFLNEITEKFVHSFNMLCACFWGRLSDNGEMGADLKAVTYVEAKFVFILVIRGHKKEWLTPLQAELNKKLRYHKSIWRSSVIVMNDEIAREYHLVV